MSDARALLIEGIEILCENDSDIELLIAPNKDKIVVLLCKYTNEIETFNPAYGLVGSRDTEELIIKHILDSLAPMGIISRLLSSLCGLRTTQCETFLIADAGSGAGLPGIPLAIAIPDAGFTLIERMGRRAGFLHNTKAVLSLANVNIEENELEKTAGGQFDLITFRAFAPLEPKLLKTLCKVCKPDGIIAAYKGRREKIEEELTSLQNLNLNYEIIPYKVPFLDEQRHLLIFNNKYRAFRAHRLLI
ncbi:MAG: 16S rRNA (guanine(527)-N(7))-methyltransferase RsmG [Treponema sp.]|nr:16S rRNA (guanine(527)-N(7))-methyltransferase RsmG [Treponema sp.]